MLLHDSHKAEYRTPAGPAAAGSQIRFMLRCDDAAAVILRTWNGDHHDFPMVMHGGDVWTVTIGAPDAPCLMWYDFLIYHTNGHTFHYGAPSDGLGGEGQVYQDGYHSWQITIYDPAYQVPAWMQGATMYQIFPDRFRKAPTDAVDTRTDRLVHRDWDEDFFVDEQGEMIINGSQDFYGGTLNGIREKLPYLRDLGVTVIYLNPIFQSHSNHRYDTGDYTRVDPMLGTNEELSLLCEEAHAMGIRIMLDGVFSHTGDDSVYFNKYGRYNSVGAVQSKESPYYKWYSFERYPDKYKCWWGFTTLPECRKDDPSYQHFMFSGNEAVVARWLKAGADAWRLDVADELSMDFLRRLRKCAKRAKHSAAVLGEVWEDASNKVAYGEMRCYCAGDTLDSVMNYPLREGILRFMTHQCGAQELVRLIEHQAEVYPAVFRYALMNLLGSHDRARAMSVLAGREGKELSRPEQRALRLTASEYEEASKKLRLCYDILFALPGSPTVYYGDEAGMSGGTDPLCRRTYPWGHEDQELQRFVQGKMTHFRDSEVLRYGHCAVEALDENTIRIRRYLDGRADALGRPNTSTAQEIFTVRRI